MAFLQHSTNQRSKKYRRTDKREGEIKGRFYSGVCICFPVHFWHIFKVTAALQMPNYCFRTDLQLLCLGTYPHPSQILEIAPRQEKYAGNHKPLPSLHFDLYILPAKPFYPCPLPYGKGGRRPVFFLAGAGRKAISERLASSAFGGGASEFEKELKVQI